MANAKLTKQQAVERLMALCARSEKSPYEVAKKLQQWGLADESVQIIQGLTEDKFLSTERFATAFARDKMRFNKWGKIKIRYQLGGHQIPSAEIEAALEQLNEEEYQVMIAQEMQKKLKSLKISVPWQQKGKLYTFGSQRGYEPEYMNRFFSKVGLE